MRILGISAFYHDSAAALVVDGNIIAAAQEERFSRRKHDSNFPLRAVGYCLEAGGITATDLDHVVFYEKPFVKFERLIETYVTFAPRGFPSFLKAMPLWLKEKLFLKKDSARAASVRSTRRQSGGRSFCSPSITRATRRVPSIPPRLKRH